GGQAASKELVVEARHRLPHLPQASDGSVLEFVEAEAGRAHPGRRTGQLTRFRLTLPQVAPVRVTRFVAGTFGLRRHVDHARSGNGTKGRRRLAELELGGHG